LVFKFILCFLCFIGFLYKDRTRQYDPKAHEKEKHPIHGTPLPFSRITAYKTTNIVKNEDKIDESHKSQLKFDYEIYLLNYTIKIKNLKYLHWVFAVFF